MKSIVKSLGVVCFIIMMMGFVGCAPKVITQTKTVIKDSVIVKEVPREVKVMIPGDTVKTVLRINCDSLNSHEGAKTQRNGRAMVITKWRVDNGQLKITATAVCDSLEKVVRWKQLEIQRLRLEKSVQNNVQIEYKTRWIDRVCRWIAGFAIGITMVVIGRFVGRGV